MTEIYRHREETIKVIYTFICAFISVAYMNEISVNARYGTHKIQAGHILSHFGSVRFFTTCVSAIHNIICTAVTIS
jgi:hypothetical protein